jgi:hypothetical protein
VLLTVAGVPLAARVHEAFLWLSGGGSVLLVPAISFALLARKRPDARAPRRA